MAWLAEQLGPDRGQRRLRRRARRHMLAGVRRLRVRQRATIDLAVRRQRQPVQHHDPRRHHVVRQHLRQRRSQCRAVEAAVTRHIAHELPPGAHLPRHHHRGAHARLLPAAAPRSRRARSGSRGSSPDDPRGPHIPPPHRLASAPDRRSDKAGRRPLRTDPARTARRSNPRGRNIPAQAQHRRCRARRRPRQEQDSDRRRGCARLVWDDRSAAEEGAIVPRIEAFRSRRIDRRLGRAVEIPHRARRGDQTPCQVEVRRNASPPHRIHSRPEATGSRPPRHDRSASARSAGRIACMIVTLFAAAIAARRAGSRAAARSARTIRAPANQRQATAARDLRRGQSEQRSAARATVGPCRKSRRSPRKEVRQCHRDEPARPLDAGGARGVDDMREAVGMNAQTEVGVRLVRRRRLRRIEPPHFDLDPAPAATAPAASPASAAAARRCRAACEPAAGPDNPDRAAGRHRPPSAPPAAPPPSRPSARPPARPARRVRTPCPRNRRASRFARRFSSP